VSVLSALLFASAAHAQTAAPSAPAPADARPALVTPAQLRARADALLDAVADQSVSDYRLHGDAAALFANVQSETPLAAPVYVPIDREHVDGKVGTIDGMISTADERIDAYRKRFHVDPPPDVVAAQQKAASLRDEGRASLDKTGRMAENQMGVFKYDPTKLTGGIVELNRRMALIATRIGEAFTFVTFAHEATHARDRENNDLDAKHEIDGEVHAFRVQYLALTTVDPTGMRLVVLQSTLKLRLESHPDDAITAMSLRYVEHLLDLWDTHGEEGKLRAFVEHLGYEDDPDRAAPPPAKPVPAPVRA